MLRRIRRNKCGSLSDVVLIAAMLLFLSFAILIGFKITDAFNTEVQGMTDMPASAKTASTTLLGHYPGIMDNSFLFISIGLGIVTLILAALVRVHPIFIPFYFIGLGIVIFMSAIFSNIYTEMASNAELVGLANQMTIMTNIMGALPFVVGIFGTLLMVIMYKLYTIDLQI